MLTSTFNSKSTELENKIKDADIIPKSAVTKANSIKSDLNDYAKKTDVANDITTIKNDYVTNASLTSKLNDLKAQHIATELKTIDYKTKKNANDILGFENIVDDVQRDSSDTSKYKYEGYGICFDEGGMFSMGNINNGRNVLIFGVHENSVIHSNNKANNIFIMGDGFVQGINDTTLYA